MIIKSLSRKSPTFGQLAAYMSSEKSDERFDLYRNCFSRSHADIATEFFENSNGLAKRKNGNFLYHEIISISVEDGAATPRHKECLQEIVDSYVDARCPNNMVYGCLHEDHSNNLHYHLMISANERGERGRTRLSRAHFDTIKSKLDKYRPEIEALLANGSTQKFIAKRYKSSPANLANWMKKNGIKKPRP